VPNFCQAKKVGPQNRSGQWHKSWLQNWNRQPPEMRVHLAMGGIFETLYYEIFTKALFGAEAGLNRGLASFESAARKSDGVSAADLQEWRKITVAIASALPTPNSLPADVKSILWHNLLPVMSDPKSTICSRDLQKLCEEAYDLLVKTRSTTANYRFVLPEEPAPVDENIMDIVRVDPENPDPKRVVDFALFGALVKEGSTRSEPYEVLEKAQVVVY